MSRYRLTNAALRELAETAEIYSGVDTSLGLDYLDAFEQAMELVCAYPNAFGKFDETHRRFLLRRFPHGIVYRLTEPKITVVAIIYLHSDPES